MQLLVIVVGVLSALLALAGLARADTPPSGQGRAPLGGDATNADPRCVEAFDDGGDLDTCATDDNQDDDNHGEGTPCEDDATALDDPRGDDLRGDDPRRDAACTDAARADAARADAACAVAACADAARGDEPREAALDHVDRDSAQLTIAIDDEAAPGPLDADGGYDDEATRGPLDAGAPFVEDSLAASSGLFDAASLHDLAAREHAPSKWGRLDLAVAWRRTEQWSDVAEPSRRHEVLLVATWRN
jgi:hypothetical protein